MGPLKTAILLSVLTALFMTVGFLLAGFTGSLIALVLALVINFYSYWNADKIVLRMQGARPVDEGADSPTIRLFANDTRALARVAGLPEPKIFIIETEQPNAFATGRNPKNAAVAATTGLLQMLTREETAAVMAHELAHVENRDTLTMTVTATLAGAIGWIANLAFLLPGRGRGGLVRTLAIMILAPLAASLVQMAISRSREYEADKRGARICGNPLWLASALEKIDRGARAIVNRQAEQNPAMAHLYIMNPLAGKRADNLFSTHPSTGNRIERLRAMAGEFEQDNTGQAEHGAGPWG